MQCEASEIPYIERKNFFPSACSKRKKLVFWTYSGHIQNDGNWMLFAVLPKMDGEYPGDIRRRFVENA